MTFPGRSIYKKNYNADYPPKSNYPSGQYSGGYRKNYPQKEYNNSRYNKGGDNRMNEKQKNAWIKTRGDIWITIYDAKSIGGQVLGFGFKGLPYIFSDLMTYKKEWKAVGAYAFTVMDARNFTNQSSFTYGYRPASAFTPGVLDLMSPEGCIWIFMWLSANIFYSSAVSSAIFDELTPQQKTLFKTANDLWIEGMSIKSNESSIPVDPQRLADIWRLVDHVNGITPTMLKELYESDPNSPDSQVENFGGKKATSIVHNYSAFGSRKPSPDKN